MMEGLGRRVLAELAGELGLGSEVLGSRRVGGGCIHAAYHLRMASGDEVFMKINEVACLEMFQAEAAGLRLMAECTMTALRIPRVLGTAVAGQAACLALEYLWLGGRGDGHEMGRQLANMHRCLAPDRLFGWEHENSIGATAQRNRKYADWVEFFRSERLGFQFDLARSKGLECKGTEELLGKLDTFFGDYQPLPSLLHGDLWHGNAGYTTGGQPVVFDPACYFGDRETDLAFSEMFGGFGADMYAGYAQEWPLDPGYPMRRDLYNLYHVLNHYNLFGGSYGEQACRMVRGLLSH